MKKGFLGRSLEIAGLGRMGMKAKKATEDAVVNNARLHMVERMGKLRGLPQKMGQILSMSDDEDTADAFKPLTDSAEPLPLDVVIPLLEKVWECSLDSVLEDISPSGLAASLGQVHKAKLKDGSTVAIKVRYPGIEEAVQADLKLLGWLSIPAGGFKNGFDLPAYREAILKDLSKELNYLVEAEQQQQYAENSKSLDLVYVPEIQQSLCRESVLVSEWVDGESIDSVCSDWDEQTKRKIANQIISHFVVMLFHHDCVHADPHPGNYRFRIRNQKPEIVLLDYGCLFHADAKESLFLLRLLQECRKPDGGDPYPLFLGIGFNEEFLEPLREKLPALCHAVFEPFLVSHPYDLSRANRKQKVSEILGDDRWNFRIAGPAKLIFLTRAFAGLDFYLKKLGTPVLWGKMLDEVISQRSEELASLHIPSVSGTIVPFSGMAKHLCVRVTKGGRKIGEFKFPWRSVDRLEDLMDDEVLEKIKHRGIDLAEIKKTVRAKGYMATDLFELKEQESFIRVWLE